MVMARTRHSKKTLALLAQFPELSDWIINNMTPSQLMTVKESPIDTVWFGDGHPLNSQELGVQLWRAYQHAVVFELECKWGEDENFFLPPTGCDRLVYFHHMVCDGIKLYAWAEPEVLDKIVERHRREIEAATGPAQASASQPGANSRQNRL